MKTQLDKHQSQHLIDLGLPKEKASVKHIELTLEEYRVFNLTDLLVILPKEIELDYYDEFCIKYYDKRFYAGYGYNEPYEGFGFEKFFTAEELIEALYDLLCWTLEQGYLKFE